MIFVAEPKCFRLRSLISKVCGSGKKREQNADTSGMGGNCDGFSHPEFIEPRQWANHQVHTV